MRIRGGGGVELNVVETGARRGPAVLFIHGYCQSTFAWRCQLESDLARDFRMVALDLRGHGHSEKPAVAEAYTDSRLWADDVAAVIDGLALHRPILVGWSYAGLVIGDYLRFYGAGRLAAIDFVGAVTVKGGEKSRAFGGPRFAALFPALFGNDATLLAPVLETFAELCVATPLDEGTKLALVGASALTPAVAREAMQRRRRLDNDDVLSALEIPVLCTHGADDAVVLPASGEHNAAVIPGARLSIYPGVGHSPFAEDPRRFNRELRELAQKAA